MNENQKPLKLEFERYYKMDIESLREEFRSARKYAICQGIGVGFFMVFSQIISFFPGGIPVKSVMTLILMIAFFLLVFFVIHCRCKFIEKILCEREMGLLNKVNLQEPDASQTPKTEPAEKVEEKSEISY